MRYSVVVADLDGTLLDQNHTINQFTRKTLQLVRQRGILFIIATGRHYMDVKHIQQNIGVDGFLITSNGAMVHDPLGNPFFFHEFSESIGIDLVRIAWDDPAVVTNAYCATDWFINRKVPNLGQFHPVSNFHYNLFPADLSSLRQICKVFYLGEYHNLLKLEASINERWGGLVNASLSLAHCLEVTSLEACKGKSLESVLKKEGLSMGDCIAFGDGMNDLEMLSMVGKGCIMQNGQQRLKETLPNLEIIGSYLEDGVARYLRTLID